MGELSKLPNIGKVLENQLNDVGINKLKLEIKKKKEVRIRN